MSLIEVVEGQALPSSRFLVADYVAIWILCGLSG